MLVFGNKIIYQYGRIDSLICPYNGKIIEATIRKKENITRYGEVIWIEIDILINGIVYFCQSQSDLIVNAERPVDQLFKDFKNRLRLPVNNMSEILYRYKRCFGKDIYSQPYSNNRYPILYDIFQTQNLSNRDINPGEIQHFSLTIEEIIC